MNQDTVKSVTISQADFPSANNPYRLEGLVANTEYTISVVASTTAGEGPASAEQLTAMTNFGGGFYSVADVRTCTYVYVCQYQFQFSSVLKLTA